MKDIDIDRRGVLKSIFGAAILLNLPAPTFAKAILGKYQFKDATVNLSCVMDKVSDEETIVNFYYEKIIALYSTAYALIDKFEKNDIRKYVTQFRGKSEEMHHLSVIFPKYFDSLWLEFSSKLPLNGTTTDVYLLPMPEDILGGSVRSYQKRDLVILGSEVMSFAPSAGIGGAVFIHHELAHLYHQQQNAEIRIASRSYFDGNKKSPAKLFQIVWLEGFAVFVSQYVNSTATFFDLFRSKELEMLDKKQKSDLIAFLLHNFDSTDDRVIAEFVFNGNTKLSLPSKSGYYLGYLVAQRLSQRFKVEILARLKGEKLRSLLKSTLTELLQDTV